MDYSIIVESNQEISKRQYYNSYGTQINKETDNNEFSNSKWKIQLPNAIPLEVGDSIGYYSSMIKSKGIGDNGIELIGSANSNEELTDNKAKIDVGYYVSNNWLNNLFLPKSLATLSTFSKQVYTGTGITPSFRNADFIDTYHSYNVSTFDTTTNKFVNLRTILWSDYGAPSINTQDEWEKNGASSLSIQANEINNKTDFVFSNANPTGCGNLCFPVPDNQRLYLGADDWVGYYNNGYDSYNRENFTQTHSKEFDIIKTEAKIETNLGFNSPVVIGANITNSLNTISFDNDQFVKPQIIDYKFDLTKDLGLTSYKNYFKTFKTEQVIDETSKVIPTTFGKMLYNINDGIDNFSISNDVKTRSESTIALPTLEQRARYFWNSMLTGDIKRTRAISKLYQNLKNSHNSTTLPADVNGTSFYTGSISGTTNYPTYDMENVVGYPLSLPRNLGEQMVLMDELPSLKFNDTDKLELKNRVIFRDFQAGGNGYLNGFKVPFVDTGTPANSDAYVNLTEGLVVMTNLVANDTNFEMLKSVMIDELEIPSSDTIDIDYTNQDFLDSLYFSFEVGNLDDHFSDSIFNTSNQLNGGSTGFDIPSVINGIPVPVCLPCPNSIIPYTLPNVIANLNNVPNSYLEVDKTFRLPIYAGLFADEDNIKGHTERTGAARTFITQIDNYRSNKMYEIDFYSRYNGTRSAKDGNINLPYGSKFSFSKEGKFFDDSKIKELGLGCVVAYSTIDGEIPNTAFIGFVCREQISSKDKYNIPLPCIGEFFGLPRSFQNNSLSFTNSWERKVNYDDRGVVLVDTNIINGGEIEMPTGDVLSGKIEGATFTIQPTIELYNDVRSVGGSKSTTRIVSVRITNNGAHLQGTPIINFYSSGNQFKPLKDFTTAPQIELILGDFRNSYDAGTLGNNQPNYPYINIGSNDLTCEFDEQQSRMSLSKLHTLLLEGQQSNNLQRYYDASMYFNTEKPIIVGDPQSANEVVKINVKKSYVNSGRCGFTEDIPKENPESQIIPITNNAIRSKGILSAISGIGILDLYAGAKDGSYLKLTPYNLLSYGGTLFDKLGFNINQIIPKFGRQSTFFNKSSHNQYLETKTEAVKLYNHSVKPLSTNALITASLNQSINTNNINYLIGSLDGSNLLEKSITQITDELVAVNLPQKFSYTHLLIYSNIIPKYNYIAAQSINKIPCLGLINRSYEIGDIIYGNQQGIPYIVDKKYILTEIDVELKTELGMIPPIDSGSTIVFKINKKKPIPLELQQKK